MNAYGHYTTATSYSGTTNSTPGVITEIDFTNISGSIYIKNTDSTNILLVSFDDKVTWFSLAAGISISIDVARESIFVKSTSASVTYICLVLQ